MKTFITFITSRNKNITIKILRPGNQPQYFDFVYATNCTEAEANAAFVKIAKMFGVVEQVSPQDFERLVHEKQQNTRGALPQVKETKLEKALKVLGIVEMKSVEQVKEAFTKKVYELADGKGGYTGDMNDVVKAKEYVLSLLV